MTQWKSESEIAEAKQKAAIIAQIEAGMNSLPDKIASSMPAEYRERIRANADQAIAEAVERVRQRLGADEIEDIAGNVPSDDDSTD